MVYVIFGRKNCPYCQKAILLLGKIQFYFSEINTTSPSQMAEMYIRGVPTNHTTVPIIFNDGEFVGGLKELEEQMD
jgi:glutaredoxin